LWAKTIEFINGEFYPTYIITLKDGSYIVAGYVITSDILGQESVGAILRISAQGQILWGKEISTGFMSFINSAAPAQDGNFYISGKFRDTTLYRDLGFVAKLSPTGSNTETWDL